MKAHMKSAAENSGVVLTIGMIVKNEGQGLSECLKALEPLRNAVPCELIITDTGSSDNTVEIAERYADRVLHFKWCNDFSAARNTAIDVMQGEWFMYLDADEIFDESIMHIADFFKSGNYKNYVCAAYIQRNYTDFQHKNYSDFYATRLRRRDRYLRFHDAIHEQFLLSAPIMQIPAVAHHTGYVNLLVGNLSHCKAVRNRPLIEELIAKTPDVPRLYRHLADCYIVSTTDMWNDKIDCLKKGIACETDIPTENYLGSLQIELAKLYSMMHSDADLKFLLADWFAKPHEPIMADCELRYIAGLQAFSEKRYSDAAFNLTEFLSLYEKYLNGGFGISTNAIPIHFSTPENAATANAMLGICYAMQKDEVRAKAYMRAAKPESTVGKNGKPLLLSIFMQYAALVQDDELFEKIFTRLYAADKAFAEPFVLSFEAAFTYSRPAKTRYLNILANSKCPAVKQWAGMCINKTAAESDFDEILNLPQKSENECYAEAFYYALSYPETAVRFFDIIPVGNAKNVTLFINQRHIDFARKAFDFLSYFAKSETISTAALYWCLLLSGEAVTANNDFTDEEWQKLLRLYCRFGYAYCLRLYNKEILCDEGVSVLPSEYIYIYYLKKALDCKDGGNLAEYLKYLRLGVKHFDKMKDVTEYLLSECEKDVKRADAEHKAQQDEMQQLCTQIKNNINILIKSGNKAQAKELFDRFKLIAPNDKDIATLEKLF